MALPDLVDPYVLAHTGHPAQPGSPQKSFSAGPGAGGVGQEDGKDPEHHEAAAPAAGAKGHRLRAGPESLFFFFGGGGGREDVFFFWGGAGRTFFCFSFSFFFPPVGGKVELVPVFQELTGFQSDVVGWLGGHVGCSCVNCECVCLRRTDFFHLASWVWPVKSSSLWRSEGRVFPQPMKCLFLTIHGRKPFRQTVAFSKGSVCHATFCRGCEVGAQVSTGRSGTLPGRSGRRSSPSSAE